MERTRVCVSVCDKQEHIPQACVLPCHKACLKSPSTQEMFVLFYYRTCLDVALCRISPGGCDHRHRCGSFRGPHCANGHYRRILLHPLSEKYVSFHARAPTEVCKPTYCIIPEHTGKCPSVQIKRSIGVKWKKMRRYMQVPNNNVIV